MQVVSTACSVIGKTWTEYQEWRDGRKKAKAAKRAAAKKAYQQAQSRRAHEAFEQDAIADKEREMLRNATHEQTKRERREGL